MSSHSKKKVAITCWGTDTDREKLAKLAADQGGSQSQFLLKFIRDSWQKKYGDLDPSILG